MSASSVRDLARRHAVGELSLEEYRSKRHELIDDIITGRQPLTYGERRPMRPSSGRLSSRLMLMIGAGIGVTIIVMLAFVIAGGHAPVSPAAQQSALAPQQNLPETSPGPLLVEEFLSSNDWSASNVQNFIQQWNSLPRKEREIAKKNYRYPRLISELRQQIISQQAMSGLTKNTDAAKTQLASLQNMANMLGVE